jgi:catechol 2,3-dioxygenase-like lactoylglutathione lyase family enzyme
MEQRISLVTLGVTDLARARAFYEALGWGGAQQPDDEVCFFHRRWAGKLSQTSPRIAGHARSSRSASSP